ncbi:MAG TPA: glycosyltransferase family 2 protein [Polyangiaceae bacterium]
MPTLSLPLAIDYCAVRAGRQLLVAGWVVDREAPVTAMGIVRDANALPDASVRFMRGGRSDVSRHFGLAGSTRWGFTLVADLGSESAGRQDSLKIEFTTPRGRCLADLLPEPKSSLGRLMETTAGYSPSERMEQRALTTWHVPLGEAALEDFDIVRVEELAGFLRAWVEFAWIAPGARAVYLRGWMLDPGACVEAIHLRVGGHLSANLLGRLRRYRRGDLGAVFPGRSAADGHDGFVLYEEFTSAAVGATPAGTRDGHVERLELLVVTRRGEVGRIVVEPTVDIGAISAMRELLLAVCPNDPLAFGMMEHASGPAVALSARPTRPAEADVRVHAFGPLPEAPECTLLVPLYGRYDFLYHQLARFALDEEFQRQDLVYVVDDPHIYSAVLELAVAVYPIYRVPFRVVHAGCNLGFAGANNLGASVARAAQLLLLNSDVLPMHAGWLSRLLAHARVLPRPGAIGVRLLFHDGTIQHDGMRCVKDPLRPGVFWNDHPGKGLPVSLMPTEPVERVALVTAACLMMERALYRELGGLDDGFIFGDFEDSDLCLKALEAGRNNYLARDVVLHHLERQSQPLLGDDSWRSRVTLYNAWRYGKRWGDRIEALVVAGGQGP